MDGRQARGVDLLFLQRQQRGRRAHAVRADHARHARALEGAQGGGGVGGGRRLAHAGDGAVHEERTHVEVAGQHRREVGGHAAAVRVGDEHDDAAERRQARARTRAARSRSVRQAAASAAP